MRKTWMLGATGATLAALLVASGCYDFDKARQQCIEDGRCEPQGVGPDAGDAGDAGFDAGCTPTSDVDLPDDAFTDSDCDGVDGKADAGLFIDPANGSDEKGAGTLNSPLRTLGRALQLLRDADGGGPQRLYLAGGTYNEAELALDVPASLHGGYIRGAERWERAAANLARLDGGPVGLTVRNLSDAGVVLEYVQVSSASAEQPGHPSIALRMVRTSGVRLRHVVLEAGLGAPGQDGLNGSAGRGGGDGGPGTNAMQSIPGNAGPEGSGSCDVGGLRTGGLGGTGTSKQAGAQGNNGAPFPPGGAGGAGGATGTFICNGARTSCSCSSEPGVDGGVGALGNAGAPGPAGSGRGALVDETWRANQNQTGGPGGLGEPGAGGGGGGGGGSCVEATATVAGSGGGGGGGAGGCGGTGGTGGTGGGASIALLLLDSRVSVEEGSRLNTRGGGPGGRGGNGGSGGPGGSGGQGGQGDTVTSRPASVNYTSTSGSGGTGGNGGNGGNGGAGGGGGGGPSVGVWCDTAARLALADGGVTFALGEGGAGGASAGNRGDAGVKLNTLDCQSGL
jgi:hypothetical protein